MTAIFPKRLSTYIQIMIIVLLLPSICSVAQTEANAELKHFSSTGGAFEVDIPSSWTIRESSNENLYKCVISREAIEGIDSQFEVGVIFERTINFKKAYKSDPGYSSVAEDFALARANALAKTAEPDGKFIRAVVPPGVNPKQTIGIMEDGLKKIGKDLPISIIVQASKKESDPIRYEVTRDYNRPICTLFLFEARIDGKQWISITYQVPCNQRSDVEPIFKEIASSFKVDEIKKK